MTAQTTKKNQPQIKEVKKSFTQIEEDGFFQTLETSVFSAAVEAHEESLGEFSNTAERIQSMLSSYCGTKDFEILEQNERANVINAANIAVKLLYKLDKHFTIYNSLGN